MKERLYIFLSSYVVICKLSESGYIFYVMVKLKTKHKIMLCCSLTAVTFFGFLSLLAFYQILSSGYARNVPSVYTMGGVSSCLIISERYKKLSKPNWFYSADDMFVVNPDQRTNTTQQSILILSEKDDLVY